MGTLSDLRAKGFRLVSMQNYALDDTESYPIGRQWQARQLSVIISARHRLPFTWVTAEGEVIEMANMNNSHLRNTIQMLRRTALRKTAREAEKAIQHTIQNMTPAVTFEQLAATMQATNIDARAAAAWGAVYDELISEALCRSDGDLEEWLAR